MEIHTPITEDVRRSLKAGQLVEITGEIFSARDAAHKRMAETLKAGGQAPIPFEGNIVYYVGPTPPREGMALAATLAGMAFSNIGVALVQFWPDYWSIGLVVAG